MLVYHYDPDTGVYRGFVSEADASPLEPGVWLIPAYATEKMLPAIQGGQQAVFFDGAWHVEDIPLPPEPEPEPEPEPPPPPTTNENIIAAPITLFGGPTIAEVFGAKP